MKILIIAADGDRIAQTVLDTPVEWMSVDTRAFDQAAFRPRSLHQIEFHGENWSTLCVPRGSLPTSFWDRLKLLFRPESEESPFYG